MNNQLNQLHPYPFEKLRGLFGSHPKLSAPETINLSIGEPKHPVPEFVLPIWNQGVNVLNRYPKTRGTEALRAAISQWISLRNPALTTAPDPLSEILPVSGTREALFSFAQAVLNPEPHKRFVGMPNPFYQIYEGAAIMGGCEPLYINSLPSNDYLPDFEALTSKQWDSLQLLYLCNPHNPTGTILDDQTLSFLVEKAQQHNFIIASDECYSEIYLDQPPTSLLSICAAMGLTQFKNCVVFNSLSKRSNLAGLRSGFVAGDAGILKQYALYRTYHGCTLSPPADAVSAHAWSEESHVTQNRELYQQKLSHAFDQLKPLSNLPAPAGGFCLWLPTPNDDCEFTLSLLDEQQVIALPGQYLARHADGINPGEKHIRLALVSEQDTCIEAIQRIITALNTSQSK